MNSPDLNDPEIRALLDRNHMPKETKVVEPGRTGPDRVVETRVTCDMCGLPYPCPTRQALRDREKLALEGLWKQKARSNPHQSCGDRHPHSEHMYIGFTREFYCPGVEPAPQDCGRRVPHEMHVWVPVKNGWPHVCPGTAWEIVDCDDVPNISHKAHVWTFRGIDFWCPGG